MKKIGEILKKERENKGLSLHEIGMSLKINPKILKAIEEGDDKNLPAKTFLRGFVRSYAQYLRLDVEQISQMFQDEVGSTRPAEPKSEIEPSSPVPKQPVEQDATPISPTTQEPKVTTTKASQEKPLRRPADESLNPSSSNRMLTIIGAIVLVLLIAFVAKMVEKYQKEAAHPEEQAAVTTTLPSGPTETTLPNESVPPEAAGASGLSVATTLPKNEVMSSGPAVTTTSTTTSSTMKPTTTLRPTTTLKPTTTVRAVVAAPVPTTSTSTTLKPTTTTVKVTTTTVKSSTTSTTTTTVPGKKTVEVIVEALNTVTIKYILGDGPAETLEMTADQVHTFKGKGKITLDVTDGGAISVIVNGRDRGVPGTIGQSIKLSYP